MAEVGFEPRSPRALTGILTTIPHGVCTMHYQYLQLAGSMKMTIMSKGNKRIFPVSFLYILSAFPVLCTVGFADFYALCIYVVSILYAIYPVFICAIYQRTQTYWHPVMLKHAHIVQEIQCIETENSENQKNPVFWWHKVEFGGCRDENLSLVCPS